MPDTTSLTISLDTEAPVRCPQCRSDAGLHFDEVSLIDPSGDIVPLHAPGDESLSVVAAALSDGTQPGRSHLIVLPHWCAECGERGEIVLRQHGGQTFSQYRAVPAT
jgi:hypothetical protein